MLPKCRDTCSALGLYGFVTAVGVGFIAYTATHVYVCFCAPSGVWGFIQSLVIMDSTFCQMLMGLVHHSQSMYGAMMIAFLFSIVGAIGKGVAWMTGEAAPDVPKLIQSKPIQRM